jgi:hypothetical protein
LSKAASVGGLFFEVLLSNVSCWHLGDMVVLLAMSAVEITADEGRALSDVRE